MALAAVATLAGAEMAQRGCTLLVRDGQVRPAAIRAAIAAAGTGSTWRYKIQWWL